MTRTEQSILNDLADAVVEMEEQKTVELAREALDAGIDPYQAITDGLSRGMQTVGKKYEDGEYFVPQLIVCADAMNAGIEVLRPHVLAESAKTFGRAVIGVVEGDIHDIGKNLVRTLLEASGMEVHDLGYDVPSEKFVEESERVNAHLICMSTLMTTAMGGMERVMGILKARGTRSRYKVMVGGSPVSQKYADGIGADGYAPNAAAAVRKAKELLDVREPSSRRSLSVSM